MYNQGEHKYDGTQTIGKGRLC